MAKFDTRSDELVVSASETYSVPDAGRRVGLGKNASYNAARRGELPVLRFGRALRVPRAALDRMLAEGRLSGFVSEMTTRNRAPREGR